MIHSCKNKTRIAIIPCDADILCGKTATIKHPGNVYFRELVLSKVDEYAITKKKNVKGQIVADVLSLLNENGARFLKKLTQDGAQEGWRLISSACAREKVSHAIRDRVKERKRGRLFMPNVNILSTPPLRQVASNAISSMATTTTAQSSKHLPDAEKEKHNVATLLLHDAHYVCEEEGTFSDTAYPSFASTTHALHNTNIPTDLQRQFLGICDPFNQQIWETSSCENSGGAAVPRSGSALMCRYEDTTLISPVGMSTTPTVVVRIDDEDNMLNVIKSDDYYQQHQGNTATLFEEFFQPTDEEADGGYDIDDDEVSEAVSSDSSMSIAFLTDYKETLLGEMLPTGEELSHYYLDSVTP